MISEYKSVNIVWGLVVAMLLLVSGGIAAKGAEKIKPPNVILIVTDDQGYGDLACNGNPWIKTPEMDKLYQQGVRLTDFHVDPTCAPTRAALMTGRYSARTGVWLTYGSRNHLRRDEVTMADVFKQNGYKTAILGKWHMGDNYPFRPSDRGFDESLIHGGGVVGETPDYWDNNYYDDVYFRNNQPEKVKGYCTDVWFNEAIKFIEQNKERPFFIYLPTNVPHGPLHVPAKYRKPYLDLGLSPSRAAFYGMIATIDNDLGKLRNRLTELVLDRETIIIFLNDNGTNGGVILTKRADGKMDRNGWVVDGYNAGMRGMKTSPYEGGHRAACFIYWPNGGLTGGRDIDALTSHIDLLPTLMDLCHLKYPRKLNFDGVSLKPILQDDKAKLPERFIVVHDQGRFNQPVGEGLLIKDKAYSVMKDKWRLVGEELYDLSIDPGQRNNVAQKYPKLVKQLRADYETWWESISEKSDEYCPIVINPAKQRTVTISSQNLMGGLCAYNQRSVRSAMSTNGWTVIDVEKQGKYLIALRRWPRETNAAIGDTVSTFPQHPSTHHMRKETCVAINAVRARLKVGDYDKTVPVKRSDQEIVFRVNLQKGLQRIQTWFFLANGDSLTAYYTYIEPEK